MKNRGLSRFAGALSIRLAFAVAMIVSGLLASTLRAQTVGKQLLQGHVPPAIARYGLQPIGQLPAANQMNLAISLPLRNENALDQLLAQIYDPASTNYHHYLTPTEFVENFGPTENDYQKVIAFAKASGLTVNRTYLNRAVLDVSGDAAMVESAFQVTLRTYRHPTENRDFFAPDTEPSIDLDVPILHVSGLDNFSIPRPAFVKKGASNTGLSSATPASGSGSGGTYMGGDFHAAYAPGVTLNGAGQTVALVELDGYYASDIASYENTAGLPDVLLTNIPVDGFNAPPGSDNLEVALDIEMAVSMATNLAMVMVYEATNNGNTDIIDMLNLMATNNLAKQISCSWIIGDDLGFDTAFKEFAAQGQSFFQASGDDGAYYNNISEWADDTNITLVGGTTLSTTGPGGTWSSETAWNWAITDPYDPYAASGGGINFNSIAIPSWQKSVSMSTNQGSSTLRNVPDVAMTGDNIIVYYDNGATTTVGGTSCAAPLWAGFTALINQQAAAYNRPTVGFLNPAIYAIGLGQNYTNDFHDITTGNNINSEVADNYSAVPGYDLCTGWGTPLGQSLINALVPPDPLGITLSTNFYFIGPEGGPFSPSSEIFILTNSGSNTLTWSLVSTSAWLSASSTSGTLAVGATNNVTFSLLAAANSLAIGTYSATVQMSNWNTHIVQYLQANLQALQPFSITPTSGFNAGGPAGGPFNPASQVFSLSNSGLSTLTWSLMKTSAWFSASTTNGTLVPGATSNVTVSLTTATKNLVIGTYVTNIWFTNQTVSGAQSLPFSLQVLQPLVITPTSGFNASGFVGGPFSPHSQTFLLSNSAASTIKWAFINTSNWLSSSATNGTLVAGAITNVTVSVATNANSLAVGDYAANPWFTNQSSSGTQNMAFTLQVLQPLGVQPATGFMSVVLLKGQPSVTSQSYLLTNGGATSLNWSLINTSSWLTVSSGSALAAGATTTATISLSSTATNLPSQSYYTSTVWLTNQTSGGAAQGLQFELLLNQSLIENGDFQTGDFTGWTVNGDTVQDGYLSLFVTNLITYNISNDPRHPTNITINPYVENYFAALGEVGAQGYLVQNVPTTGGQTYLLSMEMDSPDGETPNEFSVAWDGNTLFDDVNMPKLGWTNLQFVVTATGTGTTLQIGGRNDSTYLGLDVVNLIPIQNVAIVPTTIAQTNNKLKFAWNASTGLVYQVQFATNLLQPNWTVLSSITATNTTITFVDTNPIPKFPQKYYRLRLLP